MCSAPGRVGENPRVDTGGILVFAGVAALLTVTPGADMALVTRSAIGAGRRAALATTLGIVAGLIAWATASALGVAALLSASATAFTVLELAGAAYLVLLGLETVWRAIWRTLLPGEAPDEKPPAGPASSFRNGLVTNLLNPRIAVFYAALLPQFVVPGESVLAKSLLLAGIHAGMSLVWLTAYAWLVTRAGELLRRPRAKGALEALTGTVLVGLGIRLALERG